MFRNKGSPQQIYLENITMSISDEIKTRPSHLYAFTPLCLYAFMPLRLYAFMPVSTCNRQAREIPDQQTVLQARLEENQF
jgi:hypothetical protein